MPDNVILYETVKGEVPKPADIGKTEIGRTDYINDITLSEALERVEAGDKTVIPHIKDGVKNLGADTMQHSIRNGILGDMAQQSKGLRKITQKNIDTIQKDLDKALAGKKAVGEVELFADYLKKSYPEATKDDIDIAAYRTKELLEGAAGGSKGMRAGALNSSAKSWERFMNTRQEAGARGGRNAFDYGIPEFERQLRDVVNERYNREQATGEDFNLTTEQGIMPIEDVLGKSVKGKETSLPVEERARLLESQGRPDLAEKLRQSEEKIPTGIFKKVMAGDFNVRYIDADGIWWKKTMNGQFTKSKPMPIKKEYGNVYNEMSVIKARGQRDPNFPLVGQVFKFKVKNGLGRK